MHEILASHGLAGERLAVLHGSMPQEEREKVKAAFQTSPKASAVRILLATDAASEGIDLQNYCNYLIHLSYTMLPQVLYSGYLLSQVHGHVVLKDFVIPIHRRFVLSLLITAWRKDVMMSYSSI